MLIGLCIALAGSIALEPQLFQPKLVSAILSVPVRLAPSEVKGCRGLSWVYYSNRNIEDIQRIFGKAEIENRGIRPSQGVFEWNNGSVRCTVHIQSDINDPAYSLYSPRAYCAVNSYGRTIVYVTESVNPDGNAATHWPDFGKSRLILRWPSWVSPFVGNRRPDSASVEYYNAVGPATVLAQFRFQGDLKYWTTKAKAELATPSLLSGPKSNWVSFCRGGERKSLRSGTVSLAPVKDSPHTTDVIISWNLHKGLENSVDRRQSPDWFR